MPFIRYARDKRGYESTFVMHAYRAANGSSRARVLYVFRTPSSMNVGRQPLEPEVMEALEHTHPDLTFDWTTLLREPGLPRVEVRDRPNRSSGNRRPGPRPEPPRARPPAEAPPQATIIEEDASVLGRTVGVREAARLRGRYSELLQRIARRARTPEDRDRLTERAHRLNPDDWPDQAAIQSAVPSIEMDWTAIVAELPHRRRGRRGGRLRGDGRPDGLAGLPASPEAAGGSGIISGEGDQNDDAAGFNAGPRGQSAHLDGAGGDGGDRAEPDAESASEADAAERSGAEASTAAEPGDLPGRS